MCRISLPDLELTDTVVAEQDRTVYTGRRISTGETVRVTVFSQQVSQQPGFRRAFKIDREMLEALRHHTVVGFLGAGESDGRLYFWTDACRHRSLHRLLADGRVLQAEDLIEIGWQVCSALQQSHNLGLSHGGVSGDSILLSDELQVTLVDIGVQRWLRAAEQSNESADDVMTGTEAATADRRPFASSGSSTWRNEVEQDLKDLAQALWQPLMKVVSEHQHTERPVPAGLTGYVRLLDRILNVSEVSQPMRARDLQGRLGELLIGSEGDEMPLLDHREAAMKSRRSIIDELFGHRHLPERQKLPPAVNVPNRSWKALFLPIITVLLLLIIVLLIAVLNR